VAVIGQDRVDPDRTGFTLFRTLRLASTSPPSLTTDRPADEQPLDLACALETGEDLRALAVG